MRLAVIPARGGSKRIPRKNIKAFCGRPMAVKPPNQVAVRTNSQSKRSVAEKKYGDMELADAKRLKEL